MVIFHQLGLINKNQRGFTLVEILLALLISGFLAVGIIATIIQLFNGSARNSSHMTAVRQVELAGYWISNDAQMAQEVKLDDASGFPLNSITLTWTDWNEDSNELDGDEHTVVYSLEGLEGSELHRSHYINDLENPVQTAIIARFIDSDQTRCVWNDIGLVFDVTATVQGQTETRVYEIIPRPG